MVIEPASLGGVAGMLLLRAPARSDGRHTILDTQGRKARSL